MGPGWDFVVVLSLKVQLSAWRGGSSCTVMYMYQRRPSKEQFFCVAYSTPVLCSVDPELPELQSLTLNSVDSLWFTWISSPCALESASSRNLGQWWHSPYFLFFSENPALTLVQYLNTVVFYILSSFIVDQFMVDGQVLGSNSPTMSFL